VTYNKLVNGETVPMSAEEIAARQSEETSWATERAADIASRARKAALYSKWPDPFALLDDILERGIDAVKQERNTIKLAHPKGD